MSKDDSLAYQDNLVEWVMSIARKGSSHRARKMVGCVYLQARTHVGAVKELDLVHSNNRSGACRPGVVRIVVLCGQYVGACSCLI